MREPTTRTEDPPLIALLVIAVFVILVVNAAWKYAMLPGAPSPQRRTAFEIRQLSLAVECFRAKFGMYPPSRIKLCERLEDYDRQSAFDEESIGFIHRIWPRISWATGLDWNGNGRIDSLKGGGAVILEGDQCLVFFLGGIPSNGAIPACLGFSTNPTDPTSPLNSQSGLLFEFESSRLVALHRNRFYSYLDPYRNQPFAYFSSYGIRNGYNRYWSQFRNSDCPMLGVWPYAASLGPPVEYLNPNSVQIVSAGTDRQFGAGAVLPVGQAWTPATAHQIDRAGSDDLSNFCDGVLGAP
jgi:hypothetical protein